jgi:hypothetical protein
MKDSEEVKNMTIKIIVFFVITVLLTLILWSVATETLIPLFQSKKYDEFVYNIVGIPVLLIGVGIFAYGGWIFARDTSRLMNDNIQLAENVDIIKDKTQPKDKREIARSKNTRLLFTTWKKGGFRLFIGAIFIIGGGLIVNLKKIIE